MKPSASRVGIAALVLALMLAQPLFAWGREPPEEIAPADSASEVALEEASPADVAASDEETDTVALSAQGLVSTLGWQDAVGDGGIVGTTGRALGLESLRLTAAGSIGGDAVDAASIRIKAHSSGIGWMDWSDGDQGAGVAGHSLEAVRIELCGPLADAYDIYYRAHIQSEGWMAWAKDGEAAGSTGHSLRLEALQIELVRKGDPAPAEDGSRSEPFIDGTTVRVEAHAAGIGWMPAVSFGAVAGTTGQTRQLEALRARVANAEYPGGITYQVHAAGIGWQGARSDGQIAGTTGQGRRIEALTMSLYGELADHYDLYYRAHVSGFGWLAWARGGTRAGSTGLCLPAEAVQVTLAPKGAAAPSDAGAAISQALVERPHAACEAYVAARGWVAGSDGAIAGTTGKALSLKGLRVRVDGGAIDGGISYAVHVQNLGWMPAVADGAEAGDPACKLDVQAVRMTLTGGLARHFDVWYQAHVSGIGWLGWVADGVAAGSTGLGLPIEAVRVEVLAHGVKPEGRIGTGLVDRNTSKIGWQNPSWLPQVSCKSVRLPAYAAGHGRFSYVSPSAIRVNASRAEVVEAFVRRAYQYVGTRFIEPYSTAPGDAVDCSGLVLQCLYACGVDMEHAAGTQVVGGYNPWNHLRVPAQRYNSMRWLENRTFMSVATGSLQRGDLVYYSGHVAIYVGGGRIVDSWPGRGVTERGLYAPGRIIGAQRPFV